MLTRWLVCVTLLVLIGSGSLIRADEKEIPIEDLPRVVLRAAQKAVPEGQVVAATKEDFDGASPVYEVAMLLNGKSIILEIDEDDGLVCIEKEIEADDLPRAVTRALARIYPKGKIAKIEEITETEDSGSEESVHYEVTILIEGKDPEEVVFYANGMSGAEIREEIRDVSVEKEIEVADLPKAVTRAVSLFFPKVKITKVDEITDEDDEVTYRLTLAVEDRKAEPVSFRPNGAILDDDDEEEEDETKAKTGEKPPEG